jgi:hypothetical protein
MRLRAVRQTTLESRLGEWYSRVAAADFIVPASAPVRAVALLFFLVVLIGGRNLLVLQIGPLYLGEILFAPLLLLLANRLRSIDYLVFLFFAGYVAMGTLRYGSFFWAVKDSMVFWYLPLLSLMSAALSAVELKRIWKIAWVYSWLTIVLQALPERMGAGVLFDLNKYNLSIIYIFVLLLGRVIGTLGRGAVIALVVATFLVNDFKTYYLGLLLLPLLIRYRHGWARFFGFTTYSVVAFLVIALATDNVSSWILEGYVGAINFVLDLLGIDKNWTVGTAQWRAILWGNVVSDRLSEGVFGILFGAFPGENILASSGFNRVGIGLDPRSAHNVFLDIFGYFGAVGVTFWIYIVARTTQYRNYARVFLLILVLFGLTNTIFTRVSSCLLAYLLLGALIRAEILFGDQPVRSPSGS